MLKRVIVAATALAIATVAVASGVGASAAESGHSVQEFDSVNDSMACELPSQSASESATAREMVVGMVAVRLYRNGVIPRMTIEWPKGATSPQAEAQGPEPGPQDEAVPEPDYWDGSAYSGPYDPELNNNPAYIRGNPNGLNSFDGVNEHNGRTETFYSGDNAAYRGDLWVDDDGFYRTSDGYYAVATDNDEMPQGTVFEGSQGTCVVVDGGAGTGVTDYCVSGWY